MKGGAFLAGALFFAMATGVAASPLPPGAIDTSFGTGAVASGPAATSGDFPYGAVGVGAPYVTGVSYRGSTGHLFLARFLADGTLDPAFGSAGRTLLRLDAPSDGRMVRVQADGKLLVAGTHHLSSGDQALVARFNGDGSLDTSFGTAGVVTRKVNGATTGNALGLQADGRILVAGSTSYNVNGSVDMAVFRFNSDGTPDTSFGMGGAITLDFRGGFDAPMVVSETVGNKILVAGIGTDPLSGLQDYAIARLDPSGSLDTTFGPPAQGGLVLVDAGGEYDIANAMLTGAGTIWLGGFSIRASDGRSFMSIAKLTSGGLLDTSFGTTGTVMISPGAGQTMGNAIATSSTNILIGGYYNGHFALARFNLDGTPDTSFGSAGTGMVVDADPSYGGLSALNTPGDGTIIAVGSAPEAANSQGLDILRVRYASNGSRDTSYGSGGKTLTNLYNLAWDVRAVAALPNGRIMMAGTLSDPADSEFAVMRLLPDGSRDLGFGSYGTVTIPFVKGIDRAYAMLARADGSVILGGSNNRLGTGYFALTRVSASSGVDTTFGTAGRTTHTMGIGFAEILALADAPGNKLVAAGYALVGSGNADFAIARYDANGILDPAFGTGGVVITSFGPEDDKAQAVAVQLDGKIVAAGYTRSGGLFDFAVARYDSSGALDATFGNGGKVAIPVGASNDNAHAVAILPNGKILVAGESFGGATNNDMAVVRLNANGSIDGTFGSSGVTIVNFAGGADAALAMVVQRNDRIVLAGTAFDGAGRAFALARLNADGSRDTSFGSGYAGGGLTTLDLTGSVDIAQAVAIQRDGKIVSAGVAGNQWAATRHLGDAFSTATDLDGDGRSDMLYRNASTGQVYRMLMNGLGIASSAQAYVEPNLAWHIVSDADFNGDGIADLLWRNDSTGQVFVMLFTAAGMPGAGAVIHTEPNIAWKIVATPDMDGDGKADIVWWNSNTGQVYVMLVNGLTLGAQGLMYTEPNLAWRIVAAGDFAGSGKKNQLLWRNSSTGQVYLMTVSVVGATFGQTGQVIYSEPNLAWKIVAAADFDGDGKSDILWRNDANGQVYIMQMNGPVIASQGLMYVEPNLAWKIVAQGDYNGDGRADILYRNETTGQVYMLLMNGFSIIAQGQVYAEPNTAWKLLGPYEYAQ